MKRFDTINVIPFIDIMLVLLAIVLTTASFIAQGQIQINLPTAGGKPAESDHIAVEITIDQHQQIYLNEVAIELEALKSSLAGVEKQALVVLRVDASVPFDRFVAVADILKAENLQHLSIHTRRSP